MNILVTGGHGFIGSLLIPELIKEGHRVSSIDIMWFGDNIPPGGLVHNYIGDIRNPKKNWFKDIDTIIHLAGISNDPSAELRIDTNYSINAAGTATLAQMAK